MKNFKQTSKSLCVIFVLLFITNQIYAHEGKAYLGFGGGLDYGGIGAKLELLPIKNVGIFGGLGFNNLFFRRGFNKLSAGYNAGATYKILPDGKVSPNLMLMYGYNAVLMSENSFGGYYVDMTSYGITAGCNLDIMLGNAGNKLSIGVFVPIRSKKFRDHYNSIKNDPRIEMKQDLLPVAISIGYNFKM